VVAGLIAEGAQVRVYDPMAMHQARAALGGSVTYCASAYDAASGADVVFLLTDWPEFRVLDLAAVRALTAGPYFIDGRSDFDTTAMREAGFGYRGVGRGYDAVPEVERLQVKEARL